MVHDLVHVTGKGFLCSRSMDSVVLLQQPLQGLVRIEVVLLETKYLESLALSYEPTFDSESLFCNVLSALVSEFLGSIFEPFLHYKSKDPGLSLLDGERANLLHDRGVDFLFNHLFLHHFLGWFLVQELRLINHDLFHSTRVSFLFR